jgi:hypothetical protein
MSDVPPTSQASSAKGIYVLVALLSLVLFGAGVYLAAEGKTWTLLGAGSLSIIATLLAWPMAMGTTSKPIEKLIDDKLSPLHVELTKAVNQLSRISEQQLISDRAKQLAFREKDRDAFRRAIQEDIEKKDYEAALALVEEMDAEFGYKGEAVRLKSIVLEKQDEEIRTQIDGALVTVDRHVQAEQWAMAIKEANRLKSIYPTQTRILNLPSEIENHRNSVKRDLLTKWSVCVANKQYDDAFIVLKKLDAYLTPVEAASLEEDARTVIREHQATLRNSFTDAIQAGRTSDAVRMGEKILTDFPTTQMAKEIRDRMDMLRLRLRTEQEAGQQAAVAPV